MILQPLAWASLLANARARLCPSGNRYHIAEGRP
ncbi:hypothetical protein GQF56_15410 [Rhodobacter sphaeroides]|jgi:hypothetical protein|uniref:Uncharacterized protein n=1 Tax=Cereibacter sphaeroides (strain ATCC 17023 / DSM 158 / JCM 6121 / CCUG 31486 / LMG 2827 / NBRC 12203 / NCIMB 8253 / ATH 2.4.1.) TaxID=272943 RepID=U5NRH9_CERS4|nr:hypothetical protein RSP_7624 [Cereibacter sphaeroides 2.4.1]AXC63685.1 hypothetical protein DQL45_20155 [Cereibacter sphaeroides 2.4.1]MVX49238.1 hypothetical protein [Cereibacter sphaeroides]QHA12025.1 hypothetical protein GQR99_20135 [Cereibacter sphaeroides]QHA15226.1 hypothetical protein GQY06_20095 [Cereibacter sphaeroides]